MLLRGGCCGGGPGAQAERAGGAEEVMRVARENAVLRADAERARRDAASAEEEFKARRRRCGLRLLGGGAAAPGARTLQGCLNKLE